MSKLKVFLTLTGYQLTWIACVFSESKFNEPLLGVYVGSIYLLIFVYFNKRRIHFLKVSILISVPGYIFDSLIVYFSIYEFNSSFIIGTIPIWMIVLWISFSTLFDEILVFFKNYKYLGILVSGTFAPLTYYLGQPIGVISIFNFPLFFILMIAFWVLLMIFYLEVILKKS